MNDDPTLLGQSKRMIIGRVTVEKLNEQVNEHEDRIQALEALTTPAPTVLVLDEDKPDTIALLEEENDELATRVLELEEEIQYLRSQLP